MFGRREQRGVVGWHDLDIARGDTCAVGRVVQDGREEMVD